MEVVENLVADMAVVETVVDWVGLGVARWEGEVVVVVVGQEVVVAVVH